jgi:DNA (cytosine-5)-methyltransferase 1
MNYSVLDLFAGCGGLSLGLESAGFHTVAANELEPVFCTTFALNHPNAEVIPGSILDPGVFQRIVAAGKEVDVIAGGPPCQGFSTVGKKDEADPRNRLFRAFLAAVDSIRPKIVLFENVAGFKRLYQGRAFDALVEALDRMGYTSEFRVLNAASFGAPQIRERTIVVAWARGIAQTFRFPEETHAPAADLFGRKPFVTMGEALGDLPLIGMGEVSSVYSRNPMNEFQVLMRDRAEDALNEHEGPNHGPRLMSVLATVPLGGSIQDVPLELRPRGYFLNTYARLWWDRPATTITRNLGTPSSSRCIHPFVDRGLTTREGARLQTFPDRFTFAGSRSSKNLQIGNAVPPLLGRALGQAIRTFLNAQYAHRSSA